MTRSDQADRILEGKIGYRFKDPALLIRALTRKAFAKEIKDKKKDQSYDDQEIFRTLGDAVLKLILVDSLAKALVPTREEITLKKIELERKETLFRLALKIGIGPYIRVNTGERKQGADKQPYVLAETLEAILGAIYLDRGIGAARDAVIRWYGPEIPPPAEDS